jgi:sterol desaturase/sphingolipid hydroxylase (fatty acid hydroxylase superfamily)
MSWLMDRIAEYVSLKTMIIPVVFLSVFLLERLFPVATWLGGGARVMRNLLLAAFNFVASPLIVIPITAFAASHVFNWRPEFWSGWLGLGLDLLLLDLWIYWWHRINHVVPFLWRFHEVHHLDEMLDASSALRFHFGEVILSSLVRAGVVLALAMPLSSVVVFEILVLASAIFHHSNLKLPAAFERALSFVIVTPAIHWVHHHAKRSDTDSNYSTVLSLWDHIFGSRSHTIRSNPMKIGVENMRERNLLGLILKPFRH